MNQVNLCQLRSFFPTNVLIRFDVPRSRGKVEDDPDYAEHMHLEAEISRDVKRRHWGVVFFFSREGFVWIF